MSVGGCAALFNAMPDCTGICANVDAANAISIDGSSSTLKFPGGRNDVPCAGREERKLRKVACQIEQTLVEPEDRKRHQCAF
jgi:hypothetical protein